LITRLEAERDQLRQDCKTAGKQVRLAGKREYERERAREADRVAEVESEVDRLRRECEEVGRRMEDERGRLEEEKRGQEERRRREEGEWQERMERVQKEVVKGQKELEVKADQNRALMAQVAKLEKDMNEKDE
jgi:outer membrane murein-binding lipoprotein Lpp